LPSTPAFFLSARIPVAGISVEAHYHWIITAAITSAKKIGNNSGRDQPIAKTEFEKSEL
jgi:hypothetical protein